MKPSLTHLKIGVVVSKLLAPLQRMITRCWVGTVVWVMSLGMSLGIGWAIVPGPAAWAAAVVAAGPAPETLQTSPMAPDASAIPTEKVTQFVLAYVKVLNLLGRREGELRQAETEAEAVRLEGEIELEAFGAIEAAGLTTQEYLQLLGLANSDPDFGERVAARLQELEQELESTPSR